jgi:hypothetical protein
VVGVVVGRGPSIKSRVKGALDGARAGGLEVARVEIDKDGKIVVIAGKPMAAETDSNPWDEVLKDAAH